MPVPLQAMVYCSHCPVDHTWLIIWNCVQLCTLVCNYCWKALMNGLLQYFTLYKQREVHTSMIITPSLISCTFLIFINFLPLLYTHHLVLVRPPCSTSFAHSSLPLLPATPLYAPLFLVRPLCSSSFGCRSGK